MTDALVPSAQIVRSLRILFVARRYWPAVGGAESLLRSLARELASRHDVTVLAQRIDDGPSDRLTDSLRPPPSFDAFRDGQVRVEPLRIPALRRAMLAPLVHQVVPVLRRYAYGRVRRGAGALYALEVAPVLARHARSADLVHMWGHDLLALAAIRSARRAGVPSLVTPFAHPGQWGDDPASAHAYRSADRIVALLDADAALYRELGVPAERIDVGGVCSPGVAAGRGKALRTRAGIDGPLVLFLGVRRAYKGFERLLEAAPLVTAERPDVRFAFVGPGAPLRRTAENVLDVGSVDDVERAAWLEAADVLCLPSDGEIFPVSILEAWSVGTPVLVSDIPPLRELVELAGGGAVAARDPVALAQGLLSLLAEPSRLAALGESGRAAWRERFTPHAVAARHEGVYGSLLEKEVVCAA